MGLKLTPNPRRGVAMGLPIAIALALAGSMTSGVEAAPSAESRSAPVTTPTRVVVIVVDALRKDFVKRYDMRNIKALKAAGTNFQRSYLGHMGSETVVTHNVITSGQLPKHMGWTDEGYRDVKNVLDPQDAEPNDFYLPGDLSSEQIYALQDAAGYPKLQDYLHTAFPDRKVATISPKRYAAWTFGGRTSDITVTFGSRALCEATGVITRQPDGFNVPEYIKPTAPEDCSSRYYVNGDKNSYYDTDVFPARLYPLDGDRYTVGHDPMHQGGDVWAADAAIDIMNNENWSGIFVTLPGVDKAAHMWGAEDDPGANDPNNDHYDPMTHMAAATDVADQQVDRIVDALDANGQLDETLVVVTADHGMNAGGTRFLGDSEDAAAGFPSDSRGYYNWYYADTPVFDYLQPSRWIAPLVATDNIGISYQDSAIRIWLEDRSRARINETTSIVSKMRGVLATYRRDGKHYELVWNRSRKRLTDSEWSWFQLHGQELVNTSAARYGADVIGLLRDHTVAGVYGDHGGAQFSAQNIPIVFYGAGTTSLDSPKAIRSVDIMPTVLRAMGIPLTAPVDGIGYRLPRK